MKTAEIPSYPRTKTRMRRDALALRRRLDALARLVSRCEDGSREETILSNVAWDVERLANCIAADAREMMRVSQMRIHGGEA